MQRVVNGYRLLGTVIVLLLLTEAPAKAQTVEALGSVGFGLSLRPEGVALAVRETVSGSYWPWPFLGAGVEGGVFENFTWGSNNSGCASTGPCFFGEPQNREGWFLVPRVFIGRQFSVVHFFAGFGIGYAHVEFEVYPPASYESWMVSLEGGASLDIGPLSIVPSVCFDAIDGGAALYPKLGVGLNL